jgi:DNA-binding CsgD family transcriptional regulator
VGDGGRLPFVGRQQELAWLRDDLAAARSGRARIVCVEGSPGVGKTALLRAFLEDVGDAVIVQGSGDQDEAALAWGVLAQLASTPAAKGVAEFAGLSYPEHLGGGFLAAGAALLAALGALQRGPAVILVIDDVHWCDAPSAAALRFAARRLSNDRVLILATSSGSDSSAWIRLSEERGRLVRLRGLRTEDLSALSAAVTGSSLSPRAARRLWQHTEGHPMHARAMLEELGASRVESPTAVLPAPRSFAELIRARVADCSQPAAALLAGAAVLGHRSSLAKVIALTLPADPVSVLSEVVAAGLLFEAGTGPTREVFFPHPLIHAAIYSRLSPAERACLHNQAAGLTAGDAAVQHRLAAAIAPDDALAGELEAGAAEALITGDLRLAAVRFGQAADASERTQDRCRRLLAACQAALDAGDVSTVEANLGELEQLAGPRRDVLLARLALLHDRIGAAQSLLDRAWLGVADGKAEDPSLGATVALWQGYLALLRFAPDEATGWAATAAQHGVSEVVHPARAIEHLAMGYAGRGNEALASRLLDGREPIPESARMGELAARATLRLVTDDLDGADRSVDVMLARIGVGSQTGFAAVAACIRAEIYYRRGELEAAVTAAQQGVLIAQDGCAAAALTIAHATAVWPLAAQGHVVQAEAHLKAARARAGESPAARLWATAGAWAVACARADAEAMLEAARDFNAERRPPEPGFFPFGPILAEPLIMLGRADEALDDLVAFEQNARHLGRLSAQLTAARVRGLLELARNDQRAAGLAFGAGLELARNLPFRLEAARLQAAWGVSLLQSGQRCAARLQLTEARSLLTSMGAHAFAALVRSPESPPATARGRDVRGTLTRGETTVVGLVMSGLSNAEVAARLVISRKAVEYHLTNVYAKLGISSRTQLVLRLSTLGLPVATDTGVFSKRRPDPSKASLAVLAGKDWRSP